LSYAGCAFASDRLPVRADFRVLAVKHVAYGGRVFVQVLAIVLVQIANPDPSTPLRPMIAQLSKQLLGAPYLVYRLPDWKSQVCPEAAGVRQR